MSVWLSVVLAGLFGVQEKSSAKAGGKPVGASPAKLDETKSDAKKDGARPKPDQGKRSEQPVKEKGEGDDSEQRTLRTEVTRGRGAPAESEAGGDAVGPRKSRIQLPKIRRAEETIPNYRISARTKGGRVFTGIVIRDRRFHGHVSQGEHHKEELYASSDKFTLSFVDGAEGEVRLDWSQLKKLSVHEVLSTASLSDMRESAKRSRVARLGERNREWVERRRQEAEESDPTEKPSGPEGTETPTPPKGSTPEKVTKSEDGKPPAPETGKTPPAKKTPTGGPLEAFPPEGGWTPERKENLEWKRTVLGLFPDEKEQAFLDQYEKWLPHYQKWLAESEDGGDANG